MFLAGRPNITCIYEEIAGAEVGELQLRIICGPREIRMVGPENAIFVDDSRYPGAPGRGGPVGRVARVTPNRSFCVRVLKLFDTAVRHPLAPSGASTEVPRRISPGFAHSAAAAGDRRRMIGRSVDLKQTVCSDGRRAVVRSVDLKQNVCFFFCVKTKICIYC